MTTETRTLIAAARDAARQLRADGRDELADRLCRCIGAAMTPEEVVACIATGWELPADEPVSVCEGRR